MKYKYGERRRASEYEKALAQFWKEKRVFERSVERRPEDDSYVFYDGPPFITGVPHYGTLLSSIVKDAVPRFWTMRGRRVERRWGWDCHGLPAENFTEKHLGGTVSRVAGVKNGGFGACQDAFPQKKSETNLFSGGPQHLATRKPPSADQHPSPLSANYDDQMLQLKVGDKVSEISLEKYITTARDLMVANSESWEGVIDRVGRWVDFKGAYRTMDSSFMESVWWAFSELYKKGLIYEGEKVLMYDTSFATPVSKCEVTMDNDAYQTVTDPSVYVKFKLVNGSFGNISGTSSRARAGAGPSSRASSLSLCEVGSSASSHIPQEDSGDISETSSAPVYLLAWTTTPWTLPGNMALAVNPEMEYVEVLVGGERLIMAEKLVPKVLVDEKGKALEYEVAHHYHGKDLVSKEYEDLFSGEIHRVYGAGFVGAEEGTGIVHIAPAYGEDDFELAKKEEVPVRHVIDDNGYYYPEVKEKLYEIGVRDTDERGIEVWAANKFIAKCMLEVGKVFRIEYIKHEYPFNPRSKQRIMYRALPTWFFDVQGQKPLMLAENEKVYWFPEHLKYGRFAKNIEQAPDWNLSRNRFWATAMPVWKGDKGTVKVVGSYDELYELSGVRLEDYHRPWVDEVAFEIEGEKFTRIPEVLDCWFESGSMPFAQLHYPFENREKFEKNYPADFIVEYVGQVRAWFYYVHAINTALFGKNAYKNVITTGTLAGNDGRKMSKSLGNFTDPNELMDKYSADALRFLMLSSPVLSGEDFALVDKDVSDASRKLSMIWNVYDFFTMYAAVDDFDSSDASLSDALLARRMSNTPCSATPDASPQAAKIATAVLENPLDIWIISRVHQMRDQVTKFMEEYNIPDALEGVLPFVDDLSNWFVRRSRRRFWKGEDDADKKEAYETLYYVLVYLAKVLAPFTPFLAEELYRNMTGGESVHLLDWPEAGEVDIDVINKMRVTREIITEGLALRMRKGETEESIKVRQPLSSLKYGGEKLPEFYEAIIAEEVNVKAVAYGEKLSTVELDKTLTEELKREGLAREIVRVVQAARKKAGLNVDDRIRLSISEYPEEFAEMIRAETLASELVRGVEYGFSEEVRIEGKEVLVSLEKA